MAKPVKQSGILNFTKSDMLNVPRNLKTRSYAPETKLAYITPEEEGILAALKPGTPHEGPKGIPNYDSFGTIVDDKDVGVGGGDVRDTGGGGGYDTKGGPAEPSDEEKERNRQEYLAQLEWEHKDWSILEKDRKKAEELAALNKRHIEEARKERAGAALPTIAEERAASGQVDKVKKAVREAELARIAQKKFGYGLSPADQIEAEKRRWSRILQSDDYSERYKESWFDRWGDWMSGLSGSSGRIGDFVYEAQNAIPSILGMGAEMLKSFGLNKNDIINKLNKNPDGSTLTQREKQAVAGLIAAGRDNPDLFKGVPLPEKEGWTWKPEYSEKLLQDFFDDKYQKLGFDTAEDYYEDLVKQYETGKPTGFGGIFGVGEGRTEGLTREQVEEKLDPEDRHWMKVNRPDLYYKLTGTPQTQGGLEELAQLSMPTQGGPEDRRMSYEIQQARDAVFAQADRADVMSGREATGGEYWTPPGTTPPGTTPPGTTPPGTTPPGDDQWMTASAGKIGKYNPNINPATGMPWGYQWGTMDEYSPYAEVNLNFPFAQARDGGIVGLYNGGYLNNSNGVIGLDGGGYLDDYKAADSLMFKDPQEDEEWEYNV